jgi:chaperonin GroES
MPSRKPSRSAKTSRSTKAVKAGSPRKGKPAAGASRPRASAAPAKKSPTPRASAPTRGGRSGMANVRPLRDRVLVRRVEEHEEKVGGIIIPDTAKEKPQQAEVVAVGSGRLLENGDRVPLSVKPGDKVLLGKWSGTDVKIDGEEYLILKEDEILGVLN